MNRESPATTWITVVSGLPRSGTSLLMQLLTAAGLEPLTDGRRAADEDNPRGYYELERVKRLRHHPDLLEGAQGRALKVIAVLLAELPTDHAYRVLFVHRDLDEVLASQRQMLRRLNKPGAKLPDAQLKTALTRQVEAALAWCRSSSNVSLLELEHRALLDDPHAAAGLISAFLGGDLDVDAMAAVPDPSLHRQRR